jgi:signal peptidase I
VHSTTSKRRRINRYVEFALLLLAALALSLFVRANLAQAFYIPSGSMEPQLEVGDRVLVSRTSYRLHDVHRGDIVVFPSPTPTLGADDDPFLERVAKDLLEAVALRKPGEHELIKRVVGLPGDTVSAADGHVVIDGRQLVEPYLSEDVLTQDFGPVTVPEGQVFVMGDNRANSSDSRVIGTIEIDSIVGRAIARVWPPDRAAFL